MTQSFKEDKILICACHNSEHQILIHKDIIDGEVYIDIHLAKRSFLERLIYGIKYIFGYQCKYGAFDEFVFTKRLKRKPTYFSRWMNFDNVFLSGIW